MFRRSAPLDDKDWKRIHEIRAEVGEDYKSIRNKANGYLQDREAMKTWSFSGMGRIFNVQDVAIVEGSGTNPGSNQRIPWQQRQSAHYVPPVVFQGPTGRASRKGSSACHSRTPRQ